MFKDLSFNIKTLTVIALLLLTEGNAVLGSQSVETFSSCSYKHGIALTASTKRSYRYFKNTKSDASLEVFKLIERNSIKPSTDGETFELKNRTVSKINFNFGDNDKKPVHNLHNLQDEFETDIETDWGFGGKKREDGYVLTNPWETPYSVAIVYTCKGSGETAVCTGSLLTLEWVISAAHCFPESLLKTCDLIVIAGSKSIRERSGSTVQVRKSNIRYIHIHPNSRRTIETVADIPNDIALLKVPDKFIRTKSVDTIELSEYQWIRKVTQHCRYTGFGKVFINKTHPDDNKRKTNYLIMTNDCKCLNKYKNLKGKILCNEPKEDYGLCPGDSGGGIICKRLMGVASILNTYDSIDDCTTSKGTRIKCGSYNTLSVFCSTYPHLSWINSIVYSSASCNLPLKAVLLGLFSLLIVTLPI